jgi:large subunit ribosomal protein L21
MYAVIDDQGKQYKVSEGDRIEIDLRDAAPGDVVEFDKILFCGDEGAPKVGAPYVENAKVTAEVEEEIKAKKVIHFTLRRRKGSRRKVGHRQRYLRVRITGISV